MDFKLVIVVLLAYFIRPQDWVAGISGFNIMKPLMAVTLLAMFIRPRGVSVSSFFRTPMDWAMVAYAIYVVWVAPEGQRPFAAIFVLVAYYFVTSQALSTPRRLTLYLHFWLISLVVVAAMAVASQYGLDLTGAKPLTNAVPEKPRLVLNTYLFDNANALGHSVVTVIPLAYFLLIWRKPLSRKLLGILAIALAAYCVYLTKSKGAYIVGFSVLVASQVFGRPILFQMIALLLAVTVGLELLKSLPRMTDISRVRQDEAIMGRMLAWEKARIASKESSTGEGFKTFKAYIEFEDEEIFKATHSSYVLVGAELGPMGMFFYLGVLYASIRILITNKCRRREDETSRRAMLVLLLGYMASGWLIDRSYHLEYFFLAGAVAAFHRRLGVEAGAIDPAGEIQPDQYEKKARRKYEDSTTTRARKADKRESQPPDPSSQGKASSAEQTFDGPALAYDPGAERKKRPSDGTIKSAEEVDTSKVAREAMEEELIKRWYWKKPGIIDGLLIVLFSMIIFDVWDYLLRIYFL